MIMLVKQNPMRKTENMVVRHLGHRKEAHCTPRHECREMCQETVSFNHLGDCQIGKLQNT